jgi:hypothetical protein
MADANLTPLVGVFGGTDCMDKKKPYVLPRFAAYDPKNAKSGTDKLNPTPTLLICDDNPNIRYLLSVYIESRIPSKSAERPNTVGRPSRKRRNSNLI